MKNEAIIDFFDSCAEKWDDWSDLSDPAIGEILSLFSIPKGLKILDIGCGTGILENFLATYQPSEIMGIDISEKMIEISAKKRKYPGAHYLCTNILDFHGKEYDLAIINNAFPHFTKKNTLPVHLSSILKSNGRLIIMHTQSRAEINQRHAEKAGCVSELLPPAQELANLFQTHFKIDIIKDSDRLYVMSGIKIPLQAQAM